MNPLAPRLAVLGALFTSILFSAGQASADPAPGTPGTVTAYAADQTSVLRVLPCSMNGPLPAYASCLHQVVQATSRDLCRTHGRHTFFVQIADRNKTAQAASCR